MIYCITIFKNLNGIGSRGEWQNQYHVQTDKPIDDPAIATAARELGLMEAKFHLSNVTFTRATIATHAPKAVIGGPDNPEEVLLGFNGLIVDTPGADGIARLLPAESTLVVKRKSAGRAGRATYRHAVATQEWTGTGEGVKLTANKINAVNGALGTYMEQINQTVPLVKPDSNSATGLPAFAVKAMACSGTQNRQVTQRRKKKDENKTVAKEPLAVAQEINGQALGRVLQVVLPKLLGAPGVMEDIGPKRITAIQIENVITEAVNVFRSLTGGAPYPLREIPALPPAP